jgi:hypothetical protein
LFCNCDLDYANKSVQPNQDGFKLKSTLQLLVNADAVYMVGRSAHTLKKNTEARVFASKEMGLEVNADKTKCIFMSRDQNAGKSHKVKTDSKSFERVKSSDILEQP